MRGKTLLTAALLAGLLAGCSSSSTELELLRADPMATSAPSGLTSQSVSEDAGGTTFGKDTPSSVLRRLHLADPASALVELDHAAQDAGWVARVPLDLTVTPAAAFYKRTVDGRPLELTLTWDGTDEVVLDLSTP